MTTDAGTWWKGNTHTHTLWSDGDDFPEMVADWYKRNGYHFVSLTDHHTLADDERWWPVSPTPLGREVHPKYKARFGNWVEERLPHDSNHPNFLWSQTAEELLELSDLRFFEVYNGHPLVRIAGDSLHASNERIWDIVLTSRTARGGALLYGVATDDSHDYHRFGPSERNTGRGCVMVRAPSLEPNALMIAMERGSFYASSGVVLTDIQFDGRQLSLAIDAVPGVTYTTEFIGTRRGYDARSAAVADSAGVQLTRRYSGELGAILAESRGNRASYTMHGDELYVRARVVSSRAKANASYAGEREYPWVQPVTPTRR